MATLTTVLDQRDGRTILVEAESTFVADRYAIVHIERMSALTDPAALSSRVTLN